MTLTHSFDKWYHTCSILWDSMIRPTSIKEMIYFKWSTVRLRSLHKLFLLPFYQWLYWTNVHLQEQLVLSELHNQQTHAVEWEWLSVKAWDWCSLQHFLANISCTWVCSLLQVWLTLQLLGTAGPRSSARSRQEFREWVLVYKPCNRNVQSERLKVYLDWQCRHLAYYIPIWETIITYAVHFTCIKSIAIDV